MSCELSVLICAYNEVENIPTLFERVYAVLEGLGCTYEIVIVNDGSTDGTTELLVSLAAQFQQLKVVNFVRNFGQHAAFAAGLEHVGGERVIWMDADLQDLPEEIPALWEKAKCGHPIVYAIRKDRKDSLFRRVGSRLFFQMFQALTRQNLPRNMSTFRIMSRDVVTEFLRLKERNRISAGLIGWLGFSYGTVEVEHAERNAGESKYNWIKLSRLVFDSIAGYSYLPLRLTTYFGSLVSLGAFLYVLVTVYRKFRYGFIVPGYASTLVSVLLLGGLQLTMMGVLGEYIGRILTEVQGRPLFVIEKRLNFTEEPD